MPIISQKSEDEQDVGHVTLTGGAQGAGYQDAG